MSRKTKRRKTIIESLTEATKDLPRAPCFTPHKEKYFSLKHAETAAERQWMNDRRVLYPYSCSDHYHLTSRKPKKWNTTSLTAQNNTQQTSNNLPTSTSTGSRAASPPH